MHQEAEVAAVCIFVACCLVEKLEGKHQVSSYASSSEFGHGQCGVCESIGYTPNAKERVPFRTGNTDNIVDRPLLFAVCARRSFVTKLEFGHALTIT